MNITRFDYFIADYLDNLADSQGWSTCDKESARIEKEIHSLINSDLCPDNFFED